MLPLNGTLKGCSKNLEHETAVVVASVLHGTLEVLAGEVAGADKATVSSVAVLDWSILTTEVLGRIHSSVHHHEIRKSTPREPQ